MYNVQVALMGSDIPDITGGVIAAALSALDSHDVSAFPHPVPDGEPSAINNTPPHAWYASCR